MNMRASPANPFRMFRSLTLSLNVAAGLPIVVFSVLPLALAAAPAGPARAATGFRELEHTGVTMRHLLSLAQDFRPHPNAPASLAEWEARRVVGSHAEPMRSTAGVRAAH